MKIWILSSEIAPYSQGGIGRYVDVYARALGRKGHEVNVWAYAPDADVQNVDDLYSLFPYGPPQGWLDAAGKPDWTEAHPYYPYNVLPYPMAHSYYLAAAVIRQGAKDGWPDVIECQDYQALAYFLLQRRLLEPGPLRDIPIVIHLHTPDFVVRRFNRESPWLLPYWWISELEKACLKMADALVSPSQLLVDLLTSEKGLDDLAAEIIPLPIPIAERGAPANVTQRREVIYLGRVEWRKGIASLLKVCRKLWLEGADWQLRVFGGDTDNATTGGSLTAYLKNEYAQEIAAGRLIFEGSADRTTLRGALQNALCAVVPSLWDNLPYAALEAVEAGCILVSSLNSGLSEIFGSANESVLLYHPNNPDALADALRQATTLPAAERQRRVQSARQQLIETCKEEAVMERKLAHYETVRTRPRHSPAFPFLSLPQTRQKRATVTGSGAKVSAIIPYYELPETIETCVESVYRSTHLPLEVLLINDGSVSEASRDTLKRIEALGHPGLKLIHQANVGLAATRNHGAAMASGDVLLFLDADDWIEPEFIEKGIQVLQTYANVHSVFCWVGCFGENDHVWPGWNLEMPYLLGHNLVMPLCLVRRESFLQYGLNRPELAFGYEDWDSWIAMVTAGCGGVCLPEILAHYRVRKSSMYQRIQRAQGRYLYEHIAAAHPQAYREYGEALFHLQNANGPAQDWHQPGTWQSPYEALRQRAREGD